MIIKSKLMRKENNFELQDCKIEAIAELRDVDFQSFSRHMIDRDHFFLDIFKDKMYVDKDDVAHCVMVLSDKSDDGILVESEGASYARYSAFVPNFRCHLREQMRLVSDTIVANQEAKIHFDEFEDRFGFPCTPFNGFGNIVLAELKSRPEIRNVDTGGHGFSIQYAPQTGMTLWDLMAFKMEDVHLLDSDEEHDLATIVELDRNTLTPAGRAEWGDVLDAKVERIYEGSYGLQVDLSGCDPDRLEEFSQMLAGNCPSSDYEKWVTSDDSDGDVDIEMGG